MAANAKLQPRAPLARRLEALVRFWRDDMTREQAERGAMLLDEIKRLERLQNGIQKSMNRARNGDLVAIDDLAADASLLADQLRDARLKELSEI